MPSAFIFTASTRLRAVCAAATEVWFDFKPSENVVESIPKAARTATSAMPSIGRPLSSSSFATAAAVPLPKFPSVESFCFFLSSSATFSAFCKVETGAPRLPVVKGTASGKTLEALAVIKPCVRSASSWLRRNNANSARPVVVRCTSSRNQRD
ncbi:unannotated protein [freshwater metagenome]|uniref:Unannotated protein n=1 Tax=freshwater metagenome TaxID=449393 RepID=A0A6J6I1P7_9ZZZZ